MADAVVNGGLPGAVSRGTSDREIEAAALAARRRYRRLVVLCRLGLLVLLLAGWETGSRLGWIDPFFFAMPSAIAARLYPWRVGGPSEGRLWYHLWVTMQEALAGFFIGSSVGMVVGVALGRNRLASDIFSVYIKVINSIPRVVLAPIFIMIFG